MRIPVTILVLAILVASGFLLLRPVTPPPLAPAVDSITAEPAVTPVSPREPDLVLDLFEPTPATLDAQQNETRLTGQIEHTLTVLFLLTKCELISRAEYSDSYNALIAYAVETKLAPTPQTAELRVREIAKSAGASYSLIYSRVPCDDPSLPPLVTTLKAWRGTSPAAPTAVTPSAR